MDSIKRLTTDALQECEDNNGYEAIRIIVAAIEELAEEVEALLYPQRFIAADELDPLIEWFDEGH